MTDVATLTPTQAAQLLLQRQRMRDSLVGFAENIAIPGVAADGDDDESLVPDPVQALGADGKKHWVERAPPKTWAKLNVFKPVGSGVSHLHRVMMDAIQRTMFKEGGYGRLMVFCPPGAAKSTYCSVVGPAWYMGKRPGSRIILGSYATDLAKKHGAKARSVCEQEVYAGAFGATLTGDTAAKELWNITNGSEYMSGGILSGITGNRADGMVVDDPIKGRQAADSEATRANTKDAWENDLMSRLVPRAWVILVQTRWSEDDIAGMLLPEGYNGESGPILCRDGMVWEVLNIPAECERADDPLGRPIGDGAGSVPGSMLWSEYFDEQHWRQHRAKPRVWDALFQQRPRSDMSRQFKKEHFRRFGIESLPKGLNKYTTSDYATQDGEGDFTAHLGGGLDSSGHLWIYDSFHEQVATDKGIDGLIAMAKRSNIRRGFGETGQIRRSIEPAFVAAMKRAGHYLSIKYLAPIGEKIDRVQSFRDMCVRGQVHILDGQWGDDLIAELIKFPRHGVPDDWVDCCSLFGRALEDLVWAREDDVEVKKEGIKPFTWAWLTHQDESERKQPGRLI